MDPYSLLGVCSSCGNHPCPHHESCPAPRFHRQQIPWPWDPEGTSKSHGNLFPLLRHSFQHAASIHARLRACTWLEKESCIILCHCCLWHKFFIMNHTLIFFDLLTWSCKGGLLYFLWQCLIRYNVIKSMWCFSGIRAANSNTALHERMSPQVVSRCG